PYWPRVQIKRVGTAAAFIRFATPDGRHQEARNREKGGNARNHRGYIVDVATLAKSLLGGRWSLNTLADTLATKHRNHAVDAPGVGSRCMAPCYGRGSESGIRRVLIPGVYLDFASQYPTVFVLQRLWRFLIARGVAWKREDPRTVQALLDTVSVHDVLNPKL